jgi:hypothetical protein
MPGTVVAHHIGGSLMREVHQEVGVFGPATFAPVGTVVLGGCNETESVWESGPMPSLVVIAGHISFAITVDISPLGPGVSVSAPSVGIGLIFVVESSISSWESSPMATEGVIAGHIGLSVTVNISILGVWALMGAPSVGVFLGLFWVPPSTVAEHAPMVSVEIITSHFWLAITGKIGESGPESVTSAPSGDVSRVDSATEAGVAIGESVPMSSSVIRAGLVSSSITVEVSILDIRASMSAPSSAEFVGSGVWSVDEMVGEFGIFELKGSGGSDEGNLW